MSGLKQVLIKSLLQEQMKRIKWQGLNEDNVSAGYTTVTHVGSGHGARSLTHLSEWEWEQETSF